MNNYRIDNLQYCNWSKEIFQINNEAKLDAVHVTIAYHEDFDEVKKIKNNLDKKVMNVFNVRNSVNLKTSYGGTSTKNIKKMISKLKKEFK